MKGFFYRLHGLLAPDPDDAAAVRFVANMAEGEICEVSARKGRDLRNLRRYWQICTFIADATPGIDNKDQVDHVIKIETGHVEVFKLGDTLYQRPGSIAFDKMLDEDDFLEFMKRAVRLVLTKFTPGMADQGLIEEVERMCGARY